MMDPLFSRLKAATADEHARIEHAVTIMRANAEPPEYTAYLRSLHGFHQPLETKLRHFVNLHNREKTPLLAADLTSLGCHDFGDVSDTLPEVDCAARAYGCWYVLEGATLGGQSVYRHLANRWPEIMRQSGRYLYDYGDETGAMWSAFRAEVNARCDDERALISGAIDTFSTLRRWLSC